MISCTIQKCLKAFVNESLSNKAPCHVLIAKHIFAQNKFAIQLQEEDGELTFFLPLNQCDEKHLQKQFWLLSEFVAIMRNLENASIIFVQPIMEDGARVFCYELSQEKKCQIRQENGESIVFYEDHPTLRGETIVNPGLYKEVRRYLNSFIYPTQRLKTFVSHRFLIDSDYNNWKSLFLSRFSIIVAIVISLCSIMGTTWYNNQYGYTTLEHSQYKELIEAITDTQHIKLNIQKNHRINEKP